jgi:2-polyprenyl-3-methyl-5-hydroxy-6-metoxy-1,4-benzoquinol methylase
LEVIGEYSPCASILDAGCGEGALTRYLVGCAPKVVGIDASMTAISRAKRLVPRAQFECCTLETFTSEQVFDVVLAVEVLYYVKDIRTAIDRLRALGRSVIVSYTNRERERFERDLARYFPPERRTYYPFLGFKKTWFYRGTSRLKRGTNRVRARPRGDPAGSAE